MSYFTRSLIDEICDAGRGHLIPDEWGELYFGADGSLIYGNEEDWHEYICDEQERRVDCGDGSDE